MEPTPKDNQFEPLADLPAPPGQDAAEPKKLNPDKDESHLDPAPVWTRWMDQHFKKDCTQ